MKDYGIVQSAVKPEEIVIDEYSVWVADDIHEDDGEWVYTLTQYEKDEYIKLMDEAKQKVRADVDYIAMVTEVDLE